MRGLQVTTLNLRNITTGWLLEEGESGLLLFFFKIGFLVNRQCSSGWHHICEYLDRANLILESLKCSKTENMKLGAEWQIWEELVGEIEGMCECDQSIKFLRLITFIKNNKINQCCIQKSFEDILF